MGNNIAAMVTFRPKTGCRPEYMELIKGHYPLLRKNGMVTDRQSIIMKSVNGSVIELFEWISEKAKQDAHQSQDVIQFWDRLLELADVVTLDSLEEALIPYANFESI